MVFKETTMNQVDATTSFSTRKRVVDKFQKTTFSLPQTDRHRRYFSIRLTLPKAQEDDRFNRAEFKYGIKWCQ